MPVWAVRAVSSGSVGLALSVRLFGIYWQSSVAEIARELEIAERNLVRVHLV